MKLVFVYGPPAAGKLTVAKRLAQLTGYKLFHNHETINGMLSLFPFENKELVEVRRRLSRKFRLEIFHEAAVNEVNFITTFGMSGSKYFEFFREIKKLIAQHGEVLFIQLLPSENALYERVVSKSRIGHKVDSVQKLKEILESNPERFDKFPDEEHLTIDNTELTPLQAAQKIIRYYSLK